MLEILNLLASYTTVVIEETKTYKITEVSDDVTVYLEMNFLKF